MDYLQRRHKGKLGMRMCVYVWGRVCWGEVDIHLPFSGMHVFTPKFSSYLLKSGASSKMRAAAHGVGARDLLIENRGLKLAPTRCLPVTSLSFRILAQ